MRIRPTLTAWETAQLVVVAAWRVAERRGWVQQGKAVAEFTITVHAHSRWGLILGPQYGRVPSAPLCRCGLFTLPCWVGWARPQIMGRAQLERQGWLQPPQEPTAGR